MIKITDTDRGLSYLVRRAAALANKVEFGVGVPEDAGQYPDGTPVAVVAAAHEFGLNVPSRSFIRGWFDERGTPSFGPELLGMAQRAVIEGTPIESEVAAFGNKAVHEIQARMDAGIDPELADETIEKKRRTGSSTPETPLEDTHRLREAVTWRQNRG